MGNKLKIKEEDVFTKPIHDVNSVVTEEFVDNFIKNNDSTGTRVEDPSGDYHSIVNEQDNKDARPHEEKDVLKKEPVNLEDQLNMGLESIVPIENDSNNLLSISIKAGSPLQKYVEDPTENDALYESIDNNEPTVTILNNIMKEMAEEIAYLKTWRRENFNLKDDISEITERRVMMINKLVDTIDKREKIYAKSSVGKIDFYGEGFKKVFESFLNKIEKTFTQVNIPEQFKSIFFAQLAKEMDGFEKSAENIYYGKKKK